jgi:hypothetical protein
MKLNAKPASEGFRRYHGMHRVTVQNEVNGHVIAIKRS